MKLLLIFLGIMLSLAWIVDAGASDAPALEGDRIPTQAGDMVLRPIQHATMALGWKDAIIYVDPVGGETRFAGLPRPTLILLTDIHGDHLDVKTLTAVMQPKTRLVAPPAVAEQLPSQWRDRTVVLTNGAQAEVAGIPIQAVAAYNLDPGRTQFHPRGRGNGYVLAMGGKKIYLSGDTEDVPEMRSLKGIDVAVVCMNLPYTMDVEQAARAVRAFRPRIVYPYHCRGTNLERLRQLLSGETDIEVRIRDWYAK
ncbi:MAG TPA: MBL fold metallo-hydrolase [Candidatus Paceibacterota bacterium]|nr:MBL fold metallo-hydrolase [Verrucomicrobiota bacterium]HOX04005.1 MBL fold metallo-hydrolase [Verrucomicrobiota bacterium]HRZ46899.1 MBL fold metallo-hydrolase [Candidatus Paceibacterota bacterium]HRZ92133.1 MBL fold metallo-hydrolase [Candidatus Paceibacterota bacterium]